MTDTPGTLEERARRIVARFYQGIRDHDYAHWVMKGYKDSTNDMRLVVTALTESADEIASLRARVEAMTGALTEIAAMEIPTEFQAKGDLASGRMWRSYQAGCFGRCQAIARQALDKPNTFDISRQEARMAAVGLKDSDNA